MRARPSVGSPSGYPAGEPCRQLVRYCRRAGCGVLWYGPWPVRMDLEWIRCLSGLFPDFLTWLLARRGLRLSMPLSVKSGPSFSQSVDDVYDRTDRTAACESCLVILTQRLLSVSSPIGRSRPSFGSPCIGYRTGHSGPCSGTSPRP